MPDTVQIQADWAQTNDQAIDFIKNKPNLYEEWWGTQAEYDAILVKDPDIIYNIIYEEPQVDYFYVEDISGSDNTLSITKSDATAPTVEVFKSTDGTNWTSMGNTDTTPITATIPANSKLYLKATANAWANGDNKYNHITATGNNNVGGNAMSLLYGDNFENQTTFPAGSTWCLSGILRSNNTLVSASNLKLPATTLVQRCYQWMFDSCTSLTTAPVLNATTMAEGCYKNMFQGCTGLTIVPSLPATTLATDCYRGMFIGCTALTTLPTDLLPATTLANYCYYSMFQDCTNITNAPVLPATTLTQYCYRTMFERCTHLNTVTTYAQDITATNCLQLWLNSVAAQGQFFNLGGASYESGSSGIPSGWTEHTSL